MAESRMQKETNEENFFAVELLDDFYRDSFGKVLFVIVGLLVAIGFLIATSVYLYMNVPPPKTFAVQKEWRVQAEVPLKNSYLTTAELLQWVSNALPRSFVLDFLNYNDQLKSINQYFTNDGWRIFLNQLNIYANYNKVLNYKMFINAVPAGAPFIFNQGPVQETGVYGWWVQMPITINYFGYGGANAQTLTLQVLVVRVSTLNNLDGVAINNVLVLNENNKTA